MAFPREKDKIAEFLVKQKCPFYSSLGVLHIMG